MAAPPSGPGRDLERRPRRAHPYVLPAGSGWKYRFGLEFDVKSSEVQPGSGAAVVEYVSRHGDEPPDHTHRTEDELFYVLAGALTFHCDGQDFPAAAGDFIFLPRGLKHGYVIPPDQTVRLLAITSPVRDGQAGGWGGFIADMENGQGELLAAPPDPGT